MPGPVSVVMARVLLLVAAVTIAVPAWADPPGRGGREGGQDGGAQADGGWGDGGPQDGRRGGEGGGWPSPSGGGGGASGGGWPSAGSIRSPWPGGGAARRPASAREEGGWTLGRPRLPADLARQVARRPWFDGGRAVVLDGGWPDLYGYGWDDPLWDDGWWYQDTWFGGTWGAGGWGMYAWGRYPWPWGGWGWGPDGWGPWGESWGGPWNENGRYGRSEDPRDAPDWYPGNDGPWSEHPPGGAPFQLPNGSWPDRLWDDLTVMDGADWVGRDWPDPATYGVVTLETPIPTSAPGLPRPASFYGLDVGVEDGGCDRVRIAGPAGYIPAPAGEDRAHIPFSTLGAAPPAGTPGWRRSGWGGMDGLWGAGFILVGGVRQVPVVASMDAVDQICLAYTLEQAPVGHAVAWTDPFSRVAYIVTPTATREVAPGAYCRRYTARAALDGASHEVRGEACREDGGAWRLESHVPTAPQVPPPPQSHAP